MCTATDDEVPLTITGEIRVQTESSLWLIRPDRYLRMPVVEGPRRRSLTPDGALDDLEWIPLREVLLVRSEIGERLRIVPARRPDGARGVVTGIVVAASPSLDCLTDSGA